MASTVHWIVLALGGACLLAVVIGGVAAVLAFTQRGKDDQGGGAGKNVLLIVLACIVGLIVIVALCGGVGLMFVGWDVQTYDTPEAPRPPDHSTAPAPGPQPPSPEPPGDIEETGERSGSIEVVPADPDTIERLIENLDG